MKIKLNLIVPILCVFLFFSTEVNCAELTDVVPPSVAERLPDGIKNGGEIDTDTLGFDFIFKEILDDIASALSPAAVSLSTLLGMLMLSSAAKLLCPNIKSGISIVSCTVIGTYIIASEAETAVAVEGFASTVSTFVTAITPLFSAMFFSSASTLTGSVASAGFLFFSAVTEFISAYIFVPICKASIGFAVVNAVGGGTTSHIFKTVKEIFTFALSALAVIYIAVLSYQTSLAAAADTVAARSVKFALSSSIPIVGSTLGDAVRTTAAGISVIKSTSGALGTAVMILLASPVFVRLVISSTVYSLAAFAAEMTGCERERELFSEMKNVLGFALATLAVISLVFIISTAIFIKTSPAISL